MIGNKQTKFYTQDDVRTVLRGLLKKHSQSEIGRLAEVDQANISNFLSGRAPAYGKLLSWLGFEPVRGLCVRKRKP